jgi:hypothetical protein
MGKTILSKVRFSPQSRKERQEVIFLFGGERPPNKKACPSQNKQS